MLVYTSKNGQRIGLQGVKPRAGTSAARAIAAHADAVAKLADAEKALADLPENASKARRTTAENAVANARESVAKAASKAKAAYKFTVAEGDTLARYNLSPEVFARWSAESDPEKRAAILAESGVEPVETSSPVHPSIAAHAGYMQSVRERTPEGARSAQFALDELASGILVLPSAGRGASAKAERKSAEERAYDAAVEMFGAIEDDDETEESGEESGEAA